MRVLANIAGVAQLVEQGFCKPQVRGSIPCAGTKQKRVPLRARFRLIRRRTHVELDSHSMPLAGYDLVITNEVAVRFDSGRPWTSPSLRSGRFAVQIGCPADLSCAGTK